MRAAKARCAQKNLPCHAYWRTRFPCFLGYCPCFLGVLQSLVMETVALKLGDCAPDFSLATANSANLFSLNDVLRKGPAIVEFLRGTW